MTECILVAGVHGVGKSSLCEVILANGFPVYSASALIRQISDGDAGLYKKAANPLKNQDILLEAVRYFVKESEFILDGHFVVWNRDGHPHLIGAEIFKSLNLKKAILLIDSPVSIGARLRARDRVDMDYRRIGEMQNLEVQHATSVCNTIGTELVHISPAEHAVALNVIQNAFLQNSAKTNGDGRKGACRDSRPKPQT